MAAQATSSSSSPLGRVAGALRRRAPAAAVAPGEAPAAQSQWELFWQNFRAHRAAWVSMWVLVVMAVSCLVLPWLLPAPTSIDYSLVSAAGPSAGHPLGTDMIGRDVLSRLVNAGRVSLLIGFMVALISATLGATVGICAGYFGGRADTWLMSFVNVLMTIPPLPVLIAVSAVISAPSGPAGELLKSVPTTVRIIAILSLLGWMGISRIVRSQVISLKNQEFVEAARALGASNRRIMTVHILPNAVSVLAVFTTLAVSQAILMEGTLSFLGFGVQLPTATWGNMLLEARDVFTAVQYWWLTWFPALCILVTVLCVNFVGDGMRDAFDPKARR